ncbi:hypothetical protein LTR91_002445 [Friedmanniomyces endolithicus]|uniref:Nodulin-like domain-containing protein n=1 Tax=Friedmanniomyces endolithicus TaxID=329885 RepID=A0AAN6KYX0_9PEZI|nr:hypothetical protein LTR57_010587 [Friedmanniomyces endolithicus]KAK1008526.1 hypothetical protein LTS01_002284 [Friedmanniomyces endolithicus]KAK1010610.1 hypothetical protein LTR91_002445 [Friedmanniomyces endolithicus]KAK1037195.1 hypothetical protein LTS16_013048 [Friedmanniomyces endolithicus]
MGRTPPTPSAPHRTLRIISVIAATGIALSCGTNYAYSAWAPQFAAHLHLSATQQNLIGNFGNIGMYAMGIPGGYLIDRRGPRWGVFAGVLALACGYFPLRAAYLAGPGGYGMPWLCLMGLMTGMGSCTAFSAAIKVCATNWPRHRGTATAFPLSAFGLSAFFYTTVSVLVFPDDTAGYLLLLACGTTVMVFVSMFFLQLVKASSPYEAVPTDERPDLGRRDSNRLRRASDHERHGGRSSGEIDETSSLVDSDATSTPGDLLERKSHPTHHPKPEVTGLALLHTPKFWQLFVMLGLLCGVGLMTINNIGNNARSLWHHYDDTASHDFIQQRQLLHVSILSLASFVGRLLSGIGSDWLIHHHASRFWTLVVSALAFCAAHVVALTLENPNNLFYLSGLTGLAYGALFGVYPALVADAFGPSGLGINWGAMTMAPVLSGNIFNLAYGRILDSHSHFQGDGKGGGEVRCEEGRACYGSAYWVTLGASVVGVGWSLWCIRLEKVGRMREARELGGREHEG